MIASNLVVTFLQPEASSIQDKSFFKLTLKSLSKEDELKKEEVPSFDAAGVDLSQYEGKVKLLYSEDDPKRRGYYEGDLKKGFRHGHGRLAWRNGCIYEGEWRCDKIEGLGEMTWPSGQAYRGQLKDNNMHGLGQMTWSSPSRVCYEGEWVKGRRHGRGTIAYSNDKHKRLLYNGKNNGLQLQSVFFFFFYCFFCI